MFRVSGRAEKRALMRSTWSSASEGSAALSVVGSGSYPMVQLPAPNPAFAPCRGLEEKKPIVFHVAQISASLLGNVVSLCRGGQRC